MHNTITKGRGGFTLIEMLVVIAMIGILSAVVLTALGPSRAKAKDARIISDVNQARAIAETYYNPTAGNYDMGTINTAIATSISDADANYNGTGSCAGGHALCTVPATGAVSAFAIYGQLNTGSPSAWFCSDSTGVTKQESGISGAPSATACP